MYTSIYAHECYNVCHDFPNMILFRRETTHLGVSHLHSRMNSAGGSCFFFLGPGKGRSVAWLKQPGVPVGRCCPPGDSSSRPTGSRFGEEILENLRPLTGDKYNDSSLE